MGELTKNTEIDDQYRPAVVVENTEKYSSWICLMLQISEHQKSTELTP